jgi:site-specific recombinase XerD
MKTLTELTKEFLSYLEIEQGASQNTLSSYKSDLNRFIGFINSHQKIQSIETITTINIRNYLVNIKTNLNYSNTTMNRKINCLRSFFNYLVEYDYLATSPMKRIKPPKKEERLPVYLNENQIKKIIAITYNSTDKDSLRNYILIKLFIMTGIRRQEAVDLDFNHINFQNNTIRVFGKGKKERVIPISEQFSKELYLYLKHRLPLINNALFITSTGHRLHSSRAHTIFKRILKVAGYENMGFSLHKLRHSYATNLLINGADVTAVKELMGHASIDTTNIYAHASSEHLKESVNKLPYED